MRRFNPVLLLVVCLATFTVGVSTASARTYTWTGGSGNWGETSHWVSDPAAPNTLPGPNDDVVIPGPSTYTVTVNAFGGSVRYLRTLQLGSNSAGTQEVLIKTDQDTAYGSGLIVGSTSTIAPHGQITLDQDARSPAGVNRPQLQFDGDATNQGTIVSRFQGTIGDGPYISGAGFLYNSGTLHVQSGTLQTRTIVNTGTIRTDPGALLYASSTGGQGKGITMNGGTIINNGTLRSDGNLWHQNAGTLTGNPVNIDGPGLVDAGGTGTFLLTHGNTVTGTIPAGQTVLVGVRTEEMTNLLTIGDGGLTIAQGGTLSIQGPPANGVGVEGGNLITVDGTLRLDMPRTATSGSNDRAYIRGGVTVNPTGLIDLTPDSRLHFSANPAPRPTWTNNGTIALAPGAELALDLYSDDLFTNNGTLRFGIAGPTRFGRVSGGGSSSIALGGTAAGVLTDAYAPAVGTAFKVVDAKVRSGVFATVTGGFGATVAADGSSASLVYGGATAGPGPVSGGGPKPPAPPARDHTAPVLRAVRATASGVRLTASEAARVTVKVTRTTTGRRVKGRCVAQRPSNRRRPRCTRTITVVTKTQRIAAGTATIPLPKLPRGSYTVTVTATDTAGNAAKRSRTSLVVKATKKKRGRR